ncbi:hypothetical protein, partial [Vibrio alginolyticus]|uniref:hypothetical protein n=1 Tax=Vibrio alginolyticus TaxID=663 RepID=UPI001A8D44D6
PPVVVHSAGIASRGNRILTVTAYFLSIFAGLLQLRAALAGLPVPDAAAMQALTVGALTLAAAMLIFNFRETIQRKSVWAAG